MPRARKRMPAFTKAPPHVIAMFDEATRGLPDAERRTMFSYPAMFTRGNMFACVFQDRVMVRLGPGERDRALAMAGAKLFEPMPGRPMKEYVELPSPTAKSLAQWIRLGHAYAASLPPKRKTAKAKTAPRRTRPSP